MAVSSVLEPPSKKQLLISEAQQSNLRPAHTNIFITVSDSGFARERKPATPISFPQKAVTHIGLGFFLLPLTSAWDGSEKTSACVRYALPVGMEALPSAAGSHKPEAGSCSHFPSRCSFPLAPSICHRQCRSQGKAVALCWELKCQHHKNRSGDRSLSLLNYLLFTLVLASGISLFGLPNHGCCEQS